MTIRVCPNLPAARITLLLALFALVGLAGAAIAQQQAPPPLNLNLVFLDPAHGGPDPGAHLTESLAEKDVTLALETRLRAALAAKSFGVLSTRDNDTGLTSIQRADMANHAHPVACLLLHATNSGSGVYLAASSLPPDAEQRTVLPWETAQASFVTQSLSLLDGINREFGAASLKPVLLRASVPPIDSLTCATVLLEVAPLSGTPVTDAGYQQRIADALVSALTAWRTLVTPPKPVKATPASPASAGQNAPAVAKPRPKPVAPPPSAPVTPGAPQ